MKSSAEACPGAGLPPIMYGIGRATCGPAQHRPATNGRVMNIVVCVKQVVDTEAEKRLDPASWRLDRSVNCILNPYDEYAVEEALRIKEAHGGAVTVLCMGPDGATDAVRKALAMGADSAVLVSDPALAGSDAQGTAYALAEALKTLPWDLVLFGSRSTDGETGCVPAAVAELARRAAAVLAGQGRGGRLDPPRAPRDRGGLRRLRLPHSRRALGHQGHQRAPLSLDEGHHGRQEEADRRSRRGRAGLWTRPGSASPVRRPGCCPPACPRRARRA